MYTFRKRFTLLEMHKKLWKLFHDAPCIHITRKKGDEIERKSRNV